MAEPAEQLEMKILDEGLEIGTRNLTQEKIKHC